MNEKKQEMEMQFNVLNRWTLKVQFVAEIECADDALPGIKAGLALEWAYKNRLLGADLRDAVLRGAVLSGADLRGADLRDAVLSGADLSGADLRDADLSGAVLRGADLSDAVLSGAVLSDADLRGAVLSDAVLSGADLSGADLRDAVLRGAVLSGADLSGADLRDAVLSGAVLRGADLSDAHVIFAGVDSRGYEFYLTADKAERKIIIRAGCRRWDSFDQARAHFGAEYSSNANVPEVMAKLAYLETVAKARGYLVEAITALA